MVCSQVSGKVTIQSYICILDLKGLKLFDKLM